MSHKARITEMTVIEEGEDLNTVFATIIRIEEEGTGEYVTVKQDYAIGDGIILDYDQWKVIKSTVDKMFTEIAKHEITDITES
jgi:hypothetical protein